MPHVTQHTATAVGENTSGENGAEQHTDETLNKSLPERGVVEDSGTTPKTWGKTEKEAELGFRHAGVVKKGTFWGPNTSALCIMGKHQSPSGILLPVNGSALLPCPKHQQEAGGS